MKKIVLLAAVLCVSTAVFAEEKVAPKQGAKPAVEKVRGQGHEAFAKAHKEQVAKMKATREKMEKLVKEYDALKEGKKKEAKRSEIEQEVAAIHEEQLKFKQGQLAQFDKRLDQMKKDFAAESTPDGKKAWAAQKTAALLENKGDVKVLFERPDRPGMEGRSPKGPHMGGKPGKGPHFKGGPKGHGQKPPVDELPVQRPVAK